MKNILVTGTSKGLGLKITEKLLSEGHSVYCVSRSMTDEFKELEAKFPNNIYHKFYDLKDTENIKEKLFKGFVSLDIPLHGFVNNAALAYDDIVTNIHLEPLKDMFAVNVFSPYIIAKHAIRNMLFNRISGSITHISSISVHTGYKGLSMYASTKGALEAFSKNTAREWGVRQIRSNCLVAGFMETAMSGALSDDQKNRIYKRTSLKQATTLESVASTVAFLQSDEAESITGQNIFVDSGTI